MSILFPLRDLLATVGIAAETEQLISGVALDTRELRPGNLFLALRGQREHGLRHLAPAIARGAAAVLAELPLPADLDVPATLPAFAAPDLRARAGEIANLVYGAPSATLKVIGVTGTNGKTSTVQFIAQAAVRCGRVPASQGTLGSGPLDALAPQERTTPDVCTTHRFLGEMRDRGTDLVAMEVSSHALDQGRVDGVLFSVAVFTQLTRDHLDYHGSMDAYFAAKSRLFAAPGLRTAVINLDDAFGRRLLANLPTRVAAISYSAEGNPQAHLSARDVVLDSRGLRFELHFEGNTFAVCSALIGRFNVDNLLAASAALLALGIPLTTIVAALPWLQPVPGRMNCIGGGDAPLVVIDYAHTPDAIAKALSALGEHAPRLLSIVFGCGGERDRGKRAQMAAAAEAVADRVYVTDDNPRSENGDAIVADIRAGFVRPQQVIFERDRRAAIALAVSVAQPGDIVLIAGKGHELTQDICGRKWAFDDQAVAAECLAQLARSGNSAANPHLSGAAR